MNSAPSLPDSVLHGDVPAQDVQRTVPNRYTELDSLRGVAALTVVFYHFRSMHPVDAHTRFYPILSLLYRPFTSGKEAVYLFFVLSGFVLSIPYLRRKGNSYPVFVLRRILRIYAPYLCALALALAGAAIWNQPAGHGLSGWADLTWVQPLNSKLILQHLLFIGNYDWGQYNTAFWSLVMEMRLSIIFPLLFAAVLWMRSTFAILTALLLCLVQNILILKFPAATMTLMTLSVIGMFITGIILASNIDILTAWSRRLGSTMRAILAILCGVLYLAGEHIDITLKTTLGLSLSSAALASAGFILLAITSTRIRNFLNSTVPHYLGRISYSLYLIHGTVLFALTLAPTGRLPIPTQLLLYLCASFLLATAFCFYVEEPFMHLSRRVTRSKA